MRIPKKVKIGAVVYQVIIAHKWPDRDGDDGECVYSKKGGHKLYIGADLSQEAQEATFLHEALHAMNSTIDHAFLDSFAEQLYQFLKDNRLLK